MKSRKGAVSPIILLDIIGFAMILIAAVILRYASDPYLKIAAGLISALGIAVLGIDRMIAGVK